ncbi:MAG: ATP-binding protein [Bacteroidota bacterium]
MITGKLQLILPSLPENIHKVEKFVEDICDEFNINNTYFGNILVALTEAVENAMKHGNGNDPSKHVQLIFSSRPEGLSFVVKDEGKGFDINLIPDPTDLSIDANQAKGRGIFLIKHLADEVYFTENGSSVEVIFKITSINHELAVERMNLLKKYTGIKETSSSSQTDTGN